jgi:hypothetical protein
VGAAFHAISNREMNPTMLNPEWRRWSTVAFYAVAMAWVESAIVYYLRTHIDRIEPYQANPLPIVGGLGPVELVRELATLLMLFTVGALAGRIWRARLGYMLVAFGVWDIFYYVFLKVMCGWPKSLLDWDILFLIPLPWWGPVLAPMLIALLMIFWGTLATQFERPRPPSLSNWRVWVLNLMGVALALYVFLADAIRVADGGVEALRNLLPTYFNWPLFLVALALLAAPVVKLAGELWSAPAKRSGAGAFASAETSRFKGDYHRAKAVWRCASHRSPRHHPSGNNYSSVSRLSGRLNCARGYFCS